MKRLLFFFLGLLLATAGCTFTVRSTQGIKVSAAQFQEIKLGNTTEADLLRILGPPSKKESKPDGTTTILYVYSEIKSPTLPWGYAIDGIIEKEEEEIFEIILKGGAVQSYQFLRK